MKISEMSIEQLRKHFAELNRDQLLLCLQTREAQIEAAQQSVQATKARCVCVDFLNDNPDPVPNPDCPIHGAGFRA
jgi:hypothetical protein